MKKKVQVWKREFIIIFLLIFIIGNYQPMIAEAGNSNVVTLKPNRTYKSYDITGDGKKDKILIKSKKHPDWDEKGKELSVIINGKTYYKLKNVRYYYDAIIVQIYKLKNGKPLLYLAAVDDDNIACVNGIFQYQSRKLKQLVNFNKFFSKYGWLTCAEKNVVKVSGNMVYTKYCLMSWSTGFCTIKVNYRYQDGVLKRTGSIYDYDIMSSTEVYDTKGSCSYIANKNITAYTGTSAQKKAFTIEKGKKVIVDRCYCNGKRMMLHVKYKGKSGWIKAQASWNEKQQFTNPGYCG